MTRTARHFVIVAGTTLVLYAPSLRYPFVNFDDPALVLASPVLRDPSPEAWISAAVDRHRGTYLPVRVLSYKTDYAFFGSGTGEAPDPFPFRLHSLFLAAILHLLAYLVLRDLLRNPTAALLGALLYAMHPCHVESISWVSGRKDLLSSVFALASLLAFRRARARDPAALAPGALALFVLASLSKATALALPVWLLVEERVRGRIGRGAPARRLAGLGAFLAAAALLFLVHLGEAVEAGTAKPAAGFPEHLRTMAGGLVAHFRILALPTPLSARYRSDFSSPLFLAAVPALAAGVAALVAGLWRAQRLRPGLLLGAAWFLVFLLPTSNLVRTSTPAADRYLILPSLALPIALGAARGRTPQPVPFLAGLLALLTLARLPVWSGSIPLWDDVLRMSASRHQTYPRIKAALALADPEAAPAGPSRRRRPDAARRLLRPAERSSGWAWNVWDALGEVLLKLDDVPGALDAFDRAARASPGAALPYLHRAQARLRLAGGGAAARTLALGDFRLAVALDSSIPEAWYGLGVLHFQLGDREHAERALTEALHRAPRPDVEAEIRFLRSQLRFLRGDRAAAAEDLDAAILRDPDHALARYNRAVICLEEHDLEAARLHLEAMFRIPRGADDRRTPALEGEALYQYATCLVLLGEQERGRVALGRAEALVPGSVRRSLDDPDWQASREHQRR